MICSLAPADVRIKLFADDTKLYSIFNDVVTPDTLQSCLTAIEWSDHWQFKLSPPSAMFSMSIPVPAV